MPEGSPKMLAAAEDAAHFRVRLVRTHPGQITIFAAGPLTNIALAIAIDPKFAEQTCGIVVMEYSKRRYFMYDELAACAWLDPSINTETHDLYMDVDLSHRPSYGHTLTWLEKYKPATGVQLVHAQVDVDVAKYTRMFLNLMTH
jgi:inosine-uridine nucleoside N-ribohydrolase